ncbi:hypothetical protein CC1G_03400 [Coprinopsis cinerea okayama7|uniref:NAD(P)-binding protein n=1 Tax=Coprinopsis cinerea (strain Okayama-7 / 130 / ATCC MYA-4618 / FGSC 9003) TaxID=240176 RepID=A8NQK5_COPC7|nr:hypothetical protein CC1G_03400 [Coprinopsis cinerea okayama7\|eukprot:XP_001835618.2 hypothetical protein CC1G_03400 [Coprinopsis cinerea okayama7\
MSETKPAGKHLRAMLRETWFLGKPHWSPKDMPSLKGKVVVVTGGNSGLGLDTVKALLEHDAKVYILSRNEQKALPVIDQLEKDTKKRPLFIKTELSDLNSVKRAAEEFLRGIILPFAVTPEGYDLVFETNVTGHFYLTSLLLPLLLSTAKTAPKGEVRIINISSTAHHTVPAVNPLRLEAVKDGPLRRQWLKKIDYGFSKFVMNLYTSELAKRYKDSNIVAIAVHPGSYSTPITSGVNQPRGQRIAQRLFFIYPVKYGAWTQLWAGTAPEAADLSGKYVVPWSKLGKPRSEVEDEKMMAEVWTYLEGRIKEHELKQSESTAQTSDSPSAARNGAGPSPPS